jgi:ketosteroid isomerase-like protein
MSPGQGPHEQTLRAAVEHFNDTLAQLLADPEFPIPDFWAEDVELVNFEPSPFPGTYRGHDGLRRWTEDLFGAFGDARLDVLDVVEEGNQLAVQMKLTARGRSSGIPGSLAWGCLVTMRDGQCVRAASDVSYERTLERFGE